jgi:hypothetical protein
MLQELFRNSKSIFKINPQKVTPQKFGAMKELLCKDTEEIIELKKEIADLKMIHETLNKNLNNIIIKTNQTVSLCKIKCGILEGKKNE